MSTSTQPRQPSGTPVGGQFAGKENPECEIELYGSPGRLVTIGGREYRVVTGSYEDGRRTYDIQGKEGGGWSIVYDPATHRATAVGRRPVNPSSEWLDHGEANVLDVVEELEPDAQSIGMAGHEYPPRTPKRQVTVTDAILQELVAAQIGDTDTTDQLTPMEQFGGTDDAQTLRNFVDACDECRVFGSESDFPYSVSGYEYGNNQMFIGVMPIDRDHDLDGLWVYGRVMTAPHEVTNFQYQTESGAYTWTSPEDVAAKLAVAIQQVLPMVDRVAGVL
jgi:hypothetical protein